MAIAINNQTESHTDGATSLTWGHQCTGSNPLLIVGFALQAGRTVSSVTYNGQAMVQINNQNTGGSVFGNVYLYRNNTSQTITGGTYNIVITGSASGYIYADAASYTGVDQTNPINVTGTTTNNGTSITGTLTTTIDQCWLVGHFHHINNSNGSQTAGANTVIRIGGWFWNDMIDSNGARSTGSNSISINHGSDLTALNFAALAPVQAGTTTTTTTLTPDTGFDILVVAGAGGGGGSIGGGGGAGGYQYSANLPISGTSFSVTVGNGGRGGYGLFGDGNTANTIAGVSGGTSSFGSVLSAVGGGAGGSQGYAIGGTNGGSGGGGGTTAGTATSGQGQNGGTGTNGQFGGGGGGKTTAGGSSAGANNGGIGIANPISGSTIGQLSGSTYYLCGGGGGGGYLSGQVAGTGGLGGGGDATRNATTGTTGTANTGGGGGAGGYESSGTNGYGGAGGSGVVIIKYKTANQSSYIGGTKTTFGDYTIHTFTSSGTFELGSTPSNNYGFFQLF